MIIERMAEAIKVFDNYALSRGMTHKVISKSESIPSGYYIKYGVKMFAKMNLHGNLCWDDYLFRSDDYNQMKVNIIALGESK
jgi:hypothetical protein